MASKHHSSGGAPQPPYSFKDCLRSHLTEAALSEDERAILHSFNLPHKRMWGIIFARAEKNEGSGPSMDDAISFIGVILTVKSASEREIFPR